MTIVKLVLVALLLADICAVANEPSKECNTAPGEEERNICEITSVESGLEDDDKTNTTCPSGYSILDCVLVQVIYLSCYPYSCNLVVILYGPIS